MSARAEATGVGEKRGMLGMVAAACLIFAAIFFLFSLPFFWNQVRVLRNWPETEAQILSSEVVLGTPDGHDNLYRARLLVLYTVSGKSITSELISFESRNYEATLQQAQQFPVGSRHSVRYDPANPSLARLRVGWNQTFFVLPLIVVSMAALFLCLGAVFLAVLKAVS